ncbi:cell division protein SepF [Clostridium minihomine]|uniref:cell division protein SepF n=1 Tax=Clostridium minihomine TaxID=2045012 RepID=UPI000C76E1FA|nr:cell division protein SepF [Clostridium minihomine]
MAGLVQKFKDMWGAPEDEYEDEEYVDDRADDIISGSDNHAETIREREMIKRNSGSSSSNKVVNIHATTQLQVVLFKPERFGEETRAVADELLKMHTVVLNLENTNKDVCRRIIDFLSGVAYANGGKIKRVATSTFIITPYNVDLTGDDVLDELENNGVYF